MPVTPTYPGVYIEEIPSGVRTITGVATSITAFIGRALRGPVDEPVTIFSFGDFERQFGGLWVDSMMSYAVRDFYQNDGSQAIIIRVHNNATTARITLPTEVSSPPSPTPPGNNLFLDAASPGAWGSNLNASVNHDTGDPTARPTSPPTSSDPELFNLIITEKIGETVSFQEKFLGVSLDPTSRRYLPRVLEQSSVLVRVPKDSNGDWVVPDWRPLETLSDSVSASVSSDGADLTPNEFAGPGDQQAKRGLFALEKADLFNLLCIPPPTRGANTDATVYQAAMQYCAARRAMLIVDPPAEWGASPVTAAANARSRLSDLLLGALVKRGHLTRPTFGI
jgi:hypothetical protein